MVGKSNKSGTKIRPGKLVLLGLLIATGSCGQGGQSSSDEQSSNERTLERLKETYPRIPAGRIIIPPRSDLKNPDFDIGHHCLAEEKAGHGSFEDCLEVVGRELVAIGGPDKR